MRGDRDVVLAAVKENASALGCASDEFRTDVEVVLATVKSNGCALAYASETLRADPFLRRLSREVVALGRMPRFCGFFLTRHRQEKAARVAAQVDDWLIRHEHDPFTQSLKRRRLEPVHSITLNAVVPAEEGSSPKVGSTATNAPPNAPRDAPPDANLNTNLSGNWLG